MNIVQIEHFKESFEYEYVHSTWIGSGKVPSFKKGMTQEEVVKELKLWGFTPIKIQTVQLSDDLYCNSLDEKKRKDKTLRVC